MSKITFDFYMLTINALQVSPSPGCSTGSRLQAIHLLWTEPQQQNEQQCDQEHHEEDHRDDYHLLFIHTDLWGQGVKVTFQMATLIM